MIKWAADPPDRFFDPDEMPPVRLVDPYDRSADLNRRARSYLQVNCSHCHQFGAGGTADIELRANYPLVETKLLEAKPKQGTFGIKDAQIVAPGDPYRSVLFYRTAKRGHGRMPHIGSELVDVAGVELLHDWIRRLPIHKDEAARSTLRSLDEATALEHQRQCYPRDLLSMTSPRTQARARRPDRRRPQDRRRATQARSRKANRRACQTARETIERLLSSTIERLVVVALD